MASIHFRLTSNPDPEERLEEAALWKAMHDEYGDEIKALKEDARGDPSVPTFGRPLANVYDCGVNPVSNILEYWYDKTFLENAGRRFCVAPFEAAGREVAALHDAGLSAFVKSTRSKHAIFRIHPGTSLEAEMQDMAYSFIDGGPDLMIQELCEVGYEHRFFCIDREIVTDSPIQWSLTPIDHPLPRGTIFERPDSDTPELGSGLVDDLGKLAAKVAETMECPHASIDCAMINGRPAVVEFNPMRLGQLGLYAADVRALARASRNLLAEPSRKDELEGSILVKNI